MCHLYGDMSTCGPGREIQKRLCGCVKKSNLEVTFGWLDFDLMIGPISQCQGSQRSAFVNGAGSPEAIGEYYVGTWGIKISEHLGVPEFFGA